MTSAKTLSSLTFPLQVDIPHDQEQRARVHRVEVEAGAGDEGAVQHHQTVRLCLWLVPFFWKKQIRKCCCKFGVYLNANQPFFSQRGFLL